MIIIWKTKTDKRGDGKGIKEIMHRMWTEQNIKDWRSCNKKNDIHSY